MVQTFRHSAMKREGLMSCKTHSIPGKTPVWQKIPTSQISQDNIVNFQNIPGIPVLKHVTWTVCWLSEVGNHQTASKSPGCHPSADPLRNLDKGGGMKWHLHLSLCIHTAVCIWWFGADLVYRRRGTTLPGSRSPGLSQSAPTASGRRRVVSCSGWPSFNYRKRQKKLFIKH